MIRPYFLLYNLTIVITAVNAFSLTTLGNALTTVSYWNNDHFERLGRRMGGNIVIRPEQVLVSLLELVKKIK